MKADYLREILNYDPITGEFKWLVSPNRRIRVGSVAGNINPNGYREIRIGGKKYFAHRLAFLYMTGEIPDIVDHRDGDTSNNRWSNLREATGSLSVANTRRRSDNESGFKGIYKHGNKWRARIRVRGQDIRLGGFTTPEEAHEAYMAAAIQHFGEFACNGERSQRGCGHAG